MPFSPLTKFNVLSPRSIDNENGLVAWYTFDQPGIMIDYARGLHGTINNAPSLASGIIGNAFKFNGSSNYVTLGALPSITSPVSIAAWVNLQANPSGENFTICQRGPDSGSWDITFEFNNNNPRFQVANTSPAAFVLTGASTLATSIWYHLCAVIDSDAAKLRLYVNGSADANSGLSYSGTLRNGGTSWTIGGLNPSGGRYINAVLDDFRVYYRILAPGEVNAIYNQGLADQQGYPENDMPAILSSSYSLSPILSMMASGASPAARTFTGM
jgi:Concanavalin A-like lectin/glucanases superfamily